MLVGSPGSAHGSVVVTTGFLTGRLDAEQQEKIIHLAKDRGAESILTLEPRADGESAGHAQLSNTSDTNGVRILAVVEGMSLADGWTLVVARENEPESFPGGIAISHARHLGRSVICAGTSQVARITEHLFNDEREGTLTAIEIGGSRNTKRRTPLGAVLIEPCPHGIRATLVVV